MRRLSSVNDTARIAILLGIFALAFFPRPSSGQTPADKGTLVPSVCAHTISELQSVTDRGRYIEEYDQAGWRATDAALGSSPHPPPSIRMYIAVNIASRWFVYFGRLNDARTSFVPAIVAAQDPAKPGVFVASPVARDDVAPPVLTPYALGIESARTLFGPVARAYNIALYPLSDGSFYVYLYPAQVKADVYPIGGDERFHFSADGKTLLERHRMHRAVMEMQPPSLGAGTRIVADVHSDLFSDMPEDSDVFHVLAQFRSPLTGYVDAQGVLYSIESTGAIACKGKAPPHGG